MAKASQVFGDQLQQALAKAFAFFLGKQCQHHDFARVRVAKAVPDNELAAPRYPARKPARPDVFGPRYRGDAVSAQFVFRDGVLPCQASDTNAFGRVCRHGAGDLQIRRSAWHRAQALRIRVQPIARAAARCRLDP